MTESCWTRDDRWIYWPAVLFVGSMVILVQSYVAIKLFFLALFLVAFLISIHLRKTRIAIHQRLLWFYLCIGVIALVWAFVGLLHSANYVQGVFDSLRLYVVWSAVFVALYTLLRTGPSLRVMHSAMVVAGILIPLINFAGLYDQFSGGGLIPDTALDELDMKIGFLDGYIQITSQNIGPMFLVAPYLLSLQFRKDAGKSNSVGTKLALVLSIALVALSGRRALWIVVAVTPFTILLLSYLTDSRFLIKTTVKRFVLACAAAGVIALTAVASLPESGLDVGSISHLQRAFSSDDERTIQGPYLMHAFMQSPIFGSGFGGYAGYQRSDDRPWTYELTYHRLLFNLGIVGTGFLLTLFSIYFLLVIRLLRQFKDGSAIPFGLLVAFCSLVIGAYSNPYFGSFDFLFFAGLLSYLSTFGHGFKQPELTMGAALCSSNVS